MHTSRAMVAAALLATACTSTAPHAAAPSPSPPAAAAAFAPWPVTECGTYSGKGCAPARKLVDLTKPAFTNPTEITNPLYPISGLQSVVLLGSVDDKPFRSETTLLPHTDQVVWDGRPVEVLLVQYAAYLDRRITEVAIDRYAQADDGSVWYFGEDVYDYEDGTVALTEGTWLAGRDGAPAMIMPARPRVGDVYRPETVIGIVFEEVTVSALDKVFDGPRGKVSGVLVGSELHLDGTRSGKLFAPGYGEFYSAHEGDIEALAIASGTDRLPGPPPAELRTLHTAAWGLVEGVRLAEWSAVAAIQGRINRAWSTVAPIAPPRVGSAMKGALAALAAAVKKRDAAAGIQAAIDVAQCGIDVQLRYRPAPAVDVARFHLHAQQLRLHAAEGDRGGVTGIAADVTASGEDGQWMAGAAAYDAVVLDLMLPDIDGFETCRRLRQADVRVPIIMVTARDAVEDRVRGLDAGADDYLTKPFSLAELLARLRALVRRGPAYNGTVVQVGSLRLDPATRQVWRGDAEVMLSAKEFALLDAFMRRPGQVLGYRQLLDAAWDFGYEHRSNVVEVYVRYLREKIDRPFRVKSLETVRGVGYRLRRDGGTETAGS